jgi:membrane protease YdiL (CAAX protease family)
MTTALPRTRLFHFLAAVVSTAIFFAAIHLLPSLKTGSDPQVIVRCVVQILVAIAILYGLIRWGESREELGVRRVRGATFGWGLLCFVISAVLAILTLFSFSRLGLAQDEAMLLALASRPVPIILLIAATAALSEEIIFRSVLITELEAATGMRWLAGLISLVIFALAHAAGWGMTQVLFAAVPGLVLTLFFLWKRNLWICVLAHFLTDALGLLSAAAGMSHHT